MATDIRTDSSTIAPRTAVGASMRWPGGVSAAGEGRGASTPAARGDRPFTWPRLWWVGCHDAVDRYRQLTVHATDDGGAALSFPPGDSATLLRSGGELLAAIADRAANTQPLRTQP